MEPDHQVSWSTVSDGSLQVSTPFPTDTIKVKCLPVAVCVLVSLLSL